MWASESFEEARKFSEVGWVYRDHRGILKKVFNEELDSRRALKINGGLKMESAGEPQHAKDISKH